MQKFDYLIIDTVNLAYHVFNSPENQASNREITVIRDKRVYPNFISSFIETVRFLERKYEAQHVVLLFDNYSSRDELKQMLKPLNESSRRKNVNPQYKQGRKSATMEFYASLETIRYYFIINEPNYHTARIPNLEADDLVKPCLTKIGEDKRVLMVTNDSDWSKYLSEKVYGLPDWREDPIGIGDFIDKYGFPPSEGRITLFKILWGDTTDNIDAVFPEISPETKAYIVDTYESTEDFLFSFYDDDNLKMYSSLLKDREREVIIANQMISAIPVSMAHFNAVYTTGRQAKYIIDRMNDILFRRDSSFKVTIAKEEEQGFEFGGIKTPRKEPREN